MTKEQFIEIIKGFDIKEIEEYKIKYKDSENHNFTIQLGFDEEDKIDKAIEYIEKSKLNPLNTYCKYLYVDYDTGEIEHLDELLNILKGSDKE